MAHGPQSSYYGDCLVHRNATGSQLRSPCPVTTSAQCSKKVIWCASISHCPYSSFYICTPCPSISLILDLIALLPSRTSPSPTQAPSAATILCITRLIMHRHVRVAFFRFPFFNSAHIISRLLIAFFPDDALNPLHVFVAVIAVSTSGHHLSSSSKHHPRSIYDGRQDQATSGATATATPTQVTLTSAIANAATNMTPSGVAWPLSWPCSRNPSWQ